MFVCLFVCCVCFFKTCRIGTRQLDVISLRLNDLRHGGMRGKCKGGWWFGGRFFRQRITGAIYIYIDPPPSFSSSHLFGSFPLTFVSRRSCSPFSRSSSSLSLFLSLFSSSSASSSASSSSFSSEW